jgi:hypothetical protein
MLSVHQFVSHLDLEVQSAILGNKESFLAFLRQRFAGLSEDCAQLRSDLYAAARAKIQGKRVLVDALPNERAGVQAGGSVTSSSLWSSSNSRLASSQSSSRNSSQCRDFCPSQKPQADIKLEGLS